MSAQTQPTIHDELVHELIIASRSVARMKHPSIESILRRRGFTFEAERIADLVRAIEALDAQRAEH